LEGGYFEEWFEVVCRRTAAVELMVVP